MQLVFFGIFTGYPVVLSFFYSTLNWSGFTTATFVGLGNYRRLLEDQMFWNAFTNSFRYMAMAVPMQLGVSLFLAFLLNNTALKGRTIYRTAYFLPVITTTAIIGIIMIFIWSPLGPVNHLLATLGLISSPINFLGSGDTALFTIALIASWNSIGIFMIYWLAGLQSVSQEIYEAAKVDGASSTRTFFSVVLPMIAPIGGVIAVLCIIHALRVFDIVITMTGGGPFFTTDVISTFVYRTAFTADMGLPRLGYASAAAVFFGGVVITLGIILNLIKNFFRRRANGGVS
jgi:multiple sugar transport system permease protein